MPMRVAHAVIAIQLALAVFGASSVMRAQQTGSSPPPVPAFAFDVRAGALEPKKFSFMPGRDYTPCTGYVATIGACPGPPYQSLISTEDVGINFGIRPKIFHHRFLQADIGYDWAPRADPSFTVGALINSQGQTVGAGTAVSRVDFFSTRGQVCPSTF